MNTYDLYVRGFAAALELLDDQDFVDELVNLSPEFDPITLIKLPIENITKIYCAFGSLLDMTPLADQDDYEKLNALCTHLKNLLSIYIDDVECDLAVDSSRVEEMDAHEDYDEIREVTVVKHDLPARKSVDKRLNKPSTSSTKPATLPNDYTDYDGYKHYFI